MSQAIFSNDKGQKAGLYDEDTRTFRKEVRKSKHLHRKMNAWGFDKNIIASLLRRGCHVISVYEKEDKVFYQIKMNDFMRIAFPRDFGHGEQFFLPLRYWSVISKTKGVVLDDNNELVKE